MTVCRGSLPGALGSWVLDRLPLAVPWACPLLALGSRTVSWKFGQGRMGCEESLPTALGKGVPDRPPLAGPIWTRPRPVGLEIS